MSRKTERASDARRSPFDVTRCEHSARATVGISASHAGSAIITPAPIRANRLEKDCLLIHFPFKNKSKRSTSQMRMTASGARTQRVAQARRHRSWRYQQEHSVASRVGMQARGAGRSFDGECTMPGMRCHEVGRPVIAMLIGRSVSNHSATPRFAPRRRQRRRCSWRAPLFG
jgi:hypothetical protein